MFMSLLISEISNNAKNTLLKYKNFLIFYLQFEVYNIFINAVGDLKVAIPLSIKKWVIMYIYMKLFSLVAIFTLRQ